MADDEDILTDERPVITGVPEMVGLVIVGLTNVAALAVNEPLKVLLLSV